MFNRVSLATLKRKRMRRSMRRFLRARYESVDMRHLDAGMIFAHRVLKGLYRSFDPGNKCFDVVSIQTKTGCNYSCPFCPGNKPGRGLYGGAPPGAEMDPAILKDIAGQLSRSGFRGRISPDLLNEPLMDERLVEFVSILKRGCPRAFLFIQTNGSLLDRSLIMELIDAGMDEIYVNDYTEGHVVLDRLASMPLGKGYRAHITPEGRSFKERLSNRAGNVGIYPVPGEPLRIPCIKPFRQISIAYDGKAILCCQDWQFSQVMGDLSGETLLGIWAGEKYVRVRNGLLNSDRANNALCARCDFSGLW